MMVIQVSKQQQIILVASLLVANVDAELAQSMGQFYPLFVSHGICTVKQLVNATGRDKEVVADRLKRLTDLGYLEREHYRAWKLNVDAILALNKR